MSNIGNENILQIDQLRGQTISSLDEVTTIANSFNTVYLLVSINNDNISTSKKISLKNLLTVLINDSDNISSVFNNFFDTFSATTDSYIRVDKNSVTGAKEITLSTINTGAETELMSDFNANIENDALVTTSTLRKFVKYIESFLNNLSIEGSTPELLNIVKDFSDLNVEPDETQFKFTLQLAEYDETTGEISDGLITRESLMTILQHTTSNITTDDSSIVVGNKTYRLQIVNGVLGFTSTTDYYSAITLTLQGSYSGSSAIENLEYNSPNGSLTLNAKSSKGGTITTSTWNGIDVNTHYNTATTFNSTDNQYVKNTPKTFTLAIKEDKEGSHSQQTATVTVNVKFEKYRVFVFCSQTDISGITISSNGNNQPTIGSFTGNSNLYSSSIDESPVASFNTNINNAYVYFLLPTSLVSGTKAIYWKGNESMGDTPGSARKKTLTLYGNKEYTLFRSDEQYASDTNIHLKYK